LEGAPPEEFGLQVRLPTTFLFSITPTEPALVITRSSVQGYQDLLSALRNLQPLAEFDIGLFAAWLVVRTRLQCLG
jgi:hypothetical protein